MGTQRGKKVDAVLSEQSKHGFANGVLITAGNDPFRSKMWPCSFLAFPASLADLVQLRLCLSMEMLLLARFLFLIWRSTTDSCRSGLRAKNQALQFTARTLRREPTSTRKQSLMSFKFWQICRVQRCMRVATCLLLFSTPFLELGVSMMSCPPLQNRG